MKSLSQLLANKKLDKLYEIPPNWKNLEYMRCPLCSNKLKLPLKGKMVYCKSKKHKKPFVITEHKLNNILYK